MDVSPTPPIAVTEAAARLMECFHDLPSEHAIPEPTGIPSAFKTHKDWIGVFLGHFESLVRQPRFVRKDSPRGT